MNNKKTWYWALGIIAALLVIFLFWGAAQNNSKKNTSRTPSAGQTERVVDPGANSGTNSASAGAGSDDEASAYRRYMEDQTAIMDRMMREMELPEESGNSALDFIDGMLPHHEAAVSMAESYLNHGGVQEQLKPLAEDIITAQKTEIAQMKVMRKAISESGKKDREKADAYRKKYQNMMMAHHGEHDGHGSTGGSGGSGNIDAAFAEGMIMHHQMAVDMAKAILDNTDEEDVLALSRQIIDAQKAEISLMEKVLQDS